VIRRAKQRTELSRRRSLRRYRVDDTTGGPWAEKRARQARCREQVLSGERTPESLLFVSPQIVRAMRFTRRSDGF